VHAPGLDGKPEFFPLRPPENAEVADLVQALAQRIPALLKRRGLDPQQSDTEDPDRLAHDQPWLSEVYAASVCGRLATGVNAGRRVVFARDRIDPEAIDSGNQPPLRQRVGFQPPRQCLYFCRRPPAARRPPARLRRRVAL